MVTKRYKNDRARLPGFEKVHFGTGMPRLLCSEVAVSYLLAMPFAAYAAASSIRLADK
jgi:hypothetical protein